MKSHLQTKHEYIPATQVRECLLSALLEGLIAVEPTQERLLTGLTLDSRRVIPGFLFCALSGTKQHGLEFAAQAVAKGAVAIITETTASWSRVRCEELANQLGVSVLIVPELTRHISTIAGRYYAVPGANLDLIGVTGTNGKTSICQLLAQALNPDVRCGVIGTLGYGLPWQLVSTDCTTPDAIKLQSILATLGEQGSKIVAMEVSSHALDQWRIAGLPITTAVFTNLTRDHLDYHQNLGAYAKAKQKLFQMPKLQHAVINADDPVSEQMLSVLDAEVEAVLYSLDPQFVPSQAGKRWLHLSFVEHHSRGMRLWIDGSWGRGDVSVPVLGRFNAANLLAVLAVLLLRNPSLDTALEQLARVRGVPGRMEIFGQHPQPVVIVDYAHTPDALEQVLKELRAHQPHRLITLFGCGGERDRGKRPQMGAVAERLSDVVILTDDNPRGEDGSSIVLDIVAGMAKPGMVNIERQRGRAIRHAITTATSGDIVLIAGKGHETTQRIGDIEYPFSDRVEVERILQIIS